MEPRGPFPGKIIDSYDPENGTVSQSKALLAGDASNVASTQREFEENFEARRVALVSPKLVWEEVVGFENISDHTDPWSTTGIKKGKRIFPGLKNPNDTRIRHSLRLVAKGGLKGVECHVKSFDIDDSTDEIFDKDINGQNAVIDTNGKTGNDNRNDYLQTAMAGHFWDNDTKKWGGSTTFKKFDDQGRASFSFRVGMQPGNNYRAVASIGGSGDYAGVRVTNPSAQTYLGPEKNQTGGVVASEPLTVWRRLWMENDSMQAIPKDQFGYKRNDLSWDLASPAIKNVSYNSSSKTTSFGIDGITDQSSFLDLEYGRMIVQSQTHPVIDTRSFQVTVPGNHEGVPTGSGFRLYDDDDYGLLTSPLPRNDLANELMEKFFAPAFIKITDTGAYNL